MSGSAHVLRADVGRLPLRPGSVQTCVFAAIVAERARQERKWGQAHEHGKGSCASPDVDEFVKVAVLTEELGEVARALMDNERENLKTELVQLAACCAAWLELLTEEAQTP